MNITLDLNAEELDALTESSTLNNYSTPEALAETIIRNHVTSLVEAKRARLVTEISTATNALPFEKLAELAAINRDYIQANLAQE